MKFWWNFWDGFCVNDPKCSCIASHLHYNYIFMHYRCVLYMLNCCVLLGLDWAKPMMLLMLHVTCSCIFHAYVPSSLFWYWYCWCFSVYFFLSLFLSLVALWHLNESLLCPRTLFILGHPLHLTPLLTFGSMMIKPIRTFWRTFLDEAFIRDAKSFYQNFLILTFPLSSIVEVGSHYVASQSLVPPWSYKSFTSTCMDSILQYLILSLAFEVRALLLLQILYPRYYMFLG